LSTASRLERKAMAHVFCARNERTHACAVHGHRTPMLLFAVAELACMHRGSAHPKGGWAAAARPVGCGSLRQWRVANHRLLAECLSFPAKPWRLIGRANKEVRACAFLRSCALSGRPSPRCVTLREQHRSAGVPARWLD
jgi:hypothetical protein